MKANRFVSLLERLLAGTLEDRYGEAVLGDLHEMYRARAADSRVGAGL
jgi:hypothetical protein